MRRGKRRITWVEYPYENPDEVIYITAEPGIPVELPKPVEVPVEQPERKTEEVNK